MRRRETLQGPTAMFFQHRCDGLEEVLGGELEVGDVLGPTGFEALPFAVHEPKGELFDAGIFQVGGKRRLTWRWGGAGEDVAAGVGHAAKAKG